MQAAASRGIRRGRFDRSESQSSRLATSKLVGSGGPVLRSARKRMARGIRDKRRILIHYLICIRYARARLLAHGWRNEKRFPAQETLIRGQHSRVHKQPSQGIYVRGRKKGNPDVISRYVNAQICRTSRSTRNNSRLIPPFPNAVYAHSLSYTRAFYSIFVNITIIFICFSICWRD